MKCDKCSKVEGGRLANILLVIVTACTVLVLVAPHVYALLAAAAAAGAAYFLGVDYGRRYMRAHGIDRKALCSSKAAAIQPGMHDGGAEAKGGGNP